MQPGDHRRAQPIALDRAGPLLPYIHVFGIVDGRSLGCA
jgi:hypothetical protein